MYTGRFGKTGRRDKSCSKSGRKYELLLRIAEKTHISFRTVTENEPVNSDKYVVFEDDDPRMKACYGWETDCYIASKYSIQLQEYGVFDEVIEAILLDAEKEMRMMRQFDIWRC